MSKVSKLKSPDLKFKYAVGVGDFVACVLHSKAIGWLTKLLTGSKTPCANCSERRYALNVLFPIKIWRLFFKTHDDLLQNLAAEYRTLGYTVEINLETRKLTLSKSTSEEHTRK